MSSSNQIGTHAEVQSDISRGRKRTRSGSADNDHHLERTITVLIKRSEENAVRAREIELAREAEWAREKQGMVEKIADLQKALAIATKSASTSTSSNGPVDPLKIFKQTAISTPAFIAAWLNVQPIILQFFQAGRLEFPPPPTPTAVTVGDLPNAADLVSLIRGNQAIDEGLAAYVLGSTDIPLAGPVKAFCDNQAWSRELLVALFASYRVHASAIGSDILFIPRPVFDLSSNTFTQSQIWSAEQMVVDALKGYTAESSGNRSVSPEIIAGWLVWTDGRPIVWYAIAAEKRFIIQGTWIRRKSRSQYFDALISKMITEPSDSDSTHNNQEVVDQWLFEAGDILDEGSSIEDGYAVSLFTIDAICKQVKFSPSNPFDIGISPVYNTDEATLTDGAAEVVLRQSISYLLEQANRASVMAAQVHKGEV